MTTATEKERADLAQAERHIVEGERHITDQVARIERLRADSHDVKAFEVTLEAFRVTLNEQRKHRELILERIAYLEADAPPGSAETS